MKYWMFQNNQVVGPYDREELAEAGGFSAESLVCPEGRKGTQMGDWQRAGVVAELAEVLLRKAKVPAGMTGSPGLDAGASLIPPEPTLRDLAVLGTLQEKVSLLENSLSQVHDELRQREEEITGLKVQLDEKAQDAAQLKEKVSGLESKLESTEGGLKEEIGKTKDEVAHENELIEGLKGQLDSVRSDIQESLSKLEENQGKLRDELKEEVGGMRRAAGSPSAGTGAPAFAPVSAGADLDLPDAPLAGIPALEGAGNLGELPTPLGEAGSLEEIPAPAFENAAEGELPPPPADFPIPESDLPPPPADFPIPAGDLPPPPGLETPGMGITDLDAPPALDAMDPPPVTLEPPPALAPQMDNEMPSLEPLDTPVPGMGVPGHLVPPPSMGVQTLGGGMDAGGDADLVDLSASGAAENASKKKKGGFFKKLFRMVMILLILVAIVALGLFQGYKMGIIQPYLKHPSVKPVLAQIKPMVMPHLKSLGLLPKGSPSSAAPKEEEQAATPMDNEAAGTSMPAPEDMSDRSQDAIEFAKNWPVGTDGKTLAMILRSSAKSGRRLEPWNAERLGKDRFQVNFYEKPGSTPGYQFEVMLDAGQIRGLTGKSRQALMGKLTPAQAEPAAAASTPRVRPKSRRRGGASRRKRDAQPRKELNDDGSLTDPLGQMLMGESLGGRTPIAREKAEPEKTEPAPVKRTRSRRAKKEAPQAAPKAAPEEADPFSDDEDSNSGRSEEELTLDELLLPGVPNQ